MRSGDQPLNGPIVVVRHRRSGTHWTLDALRHNFRDVNAQILVLDGVLPWHPQHLPVQQFKQRVRDAYGIILLKTHLPVDVARLGVTGQVRSFLEDLFRAAHWLYVYGDGRDVLVSLYHYMKHFDSTVQAATFSEFIRMPNQFDVEPGRQGAENRVEYWCSHVSGWLDQPDVVELSYEQLQTSYRSAVVRVGRRLELAPLDKIEPVKTPSTWIEKLGMRVARKLGITTRTSAILPYKGATGEWRRHFSDSDIDFFNRSAGHLLRDLGYQ